jgi:hypothetical protein
VCRRFAAVLLAALVLAGCSGDKTKDASATAPKTWAHRVCTEVDTWLSGIQTSSKTLGDKVSGVTSLVEARTLFVAFLDDSTTRTDALLAAIHGAGHPDVDKGRELAADMEAGIRQGRGVFVDAKAKAQLLPTNDQAAFQKGAGDLNATLSRASASVGKQFEQLDTKYRDKRLQSAFNNDGACKKLSKS